MYSICLISLLVPLEFSTDCAIMLKKKHFVWFNGPTKHRKELQGTENSAKNYKVLQDTFKPSSLQCSWKHYKVLLNQLQGSWKHYKELQGTFKPTKCLKTLQGTTRYF